MANAGGFGGIGLQDIAFDQVRLHGQSDCGNYLVADQMARHAGIIVPHIDALGVIATPKREVSYIAGADTTALM